MTIEEQNEKLRAAGFDPVKHYLNPTTGDVYERPQNTSAVTQPTFETPSSQEMVTNPSQKPVMSQSEAFWTAAKGSLIPSAGGAGFGALGVRAGIKGGPIGMAVGGLAGSVAGSLLGESAQAEVLSPEFQAKRQEADEQYPITSSLGRFIPALATTSISKSVKELPILWQGIKNIPKAIIQGEAGVLPTVAKAAMANAGVNIGTSGAMEAYNEYQKYKQDPESYNPNIPNIALNTLLPGLISSPRPWYAKAMGFKPDAKPIDTGGELKPVVAAEPEAPVTQEGFVPKNPKLSKGGTGMSFYDDNVPVGAKFKHNDKDFIVTSERKGEAMKTGKPYRQVFARETATPEQAGEVIAEGYNDRSSLEATPDDVAQYASVQKQMMDYIRSGRYQDPEFKKLWQENENIKNKFGGMPPKLPDAPEVRSSEAEPKHQKLTDEEVQQVWETLEEIKTGKAPSNIMDKLSPSQQLEFANILYSDVNDALLAKRGLSTVTNPSLNKAGETSVASVLDRNITEGPAGLRGPGTKPHEGVHKFIRDLFYSDSAADQKQMRRLQQIYDFDIKTNSGRDNEERLVKLAEKILIDLNKPYGTKRERIINFLKEGGYSWRALLGSKDPEVIARSLVSRFRHDAPYGQRHELFGKMYEAAGVSPVKNVDGMAEEADTREADTREAYRSSDVAPPADWRDDNRNQRLARLGISHATFVNKKMHMRQPLAEQQEIVRSLPTHAARGDKVREQGIDIDNMLPEQRQNIEDEIRKNIKARIGMRRMRGYAEEDDGVNYVWERIANEGMKPSRTNKDTLAATVNTYANRWMGRLVTKRANDILTGTLTPRAKSGEAFDESKNRLLADKTTPDTAAEKLATKEETVPVKEEPLKEGPIKSVPDRPATDEELQSLVTHGDEDVELESKTISLLDKDASFEIGKYLKPDAPASKQQMYGKNALELLRKGGDDATSIHDMLQENGLTIKEIAEAPKDVRSSEQAQEDPELRKYLDKEPSYGWTEKYKNGDYDIPEIKGKEAEVLSGYFPTGKVRVKDGQFYIQHEYERDGGKYVTDFYRPEDSYGLDKLIPRKSTFELQSEDSANLLRQTKEKAVNDPDVMVPSDEHIQWEHEYLKQRAQVKSFDELNKLAGDDLVNLYQHYAENRKFYPQLKSAGFGKGHYNHMQETGHIGPDSPIGAFHEVMHRINWSPYGKQLINDATISAVKSGKISLSDFYELSLDLQRLHRTQRASKYFHDFGTLPLEENPGVFGVVDEAINSVYANPLGPSKAMMDVQAQLSKIIPMEKLRAVDAILNSEQAPKFNKNWDSTKPIGPDNRYYSSEVALEDPQINTPEFKNWFGESKVVDANGNPLRVYHGKNDPVINSFDTQKTRTYHNVRGAKFTDNPIEANNFTSVFKNGELIDEGSQIYPVYLKLKNPKSFVNKTDIALSFDRDTLEQAGYDGVIIKNKTGNTHYVAFYPEQIKSALGNRGTFDPNDPNILHSERALPDENLRDLNSEISTVAKKFGREGNIVARQARNMYAEQDFLGGKYRETLAGPVIDAKLTEEQSIGLSKYLWQMKHAGQSAVSLDEKQKRLAKYLTGSKDGAYQKLADEFTREGVEIGHGDDYRAIIKDMNYFSEMISPEAAAAMKRGDKDVRRKMIDWFVEESDRRFTRDPRRMESPLTREQATRLYDAYKVGMSFSGRDLTTNMDFNALKKAQGLGLPFELMDKNVESFTTRYANRAASAIAYNKNLANHPEAGYLLNIKNSRNEYHEAIEGMDQIADRPEVQEMMKGVLGFSDYNNHPNLYAFNRLAKNLLLGTPTAVRNILQIPNSAAPYIRKIGDVTGSLTKLMTDYESLRSRALQSGSIRRDYRNMDTQTSVLELEPAMNSWQRFANKASDAMRKYSGRNLSDTVEGMFFHALGETLAQREIASGKKGDFLKKFGNIVDKTDVAKYTPEDIQKAASEFTSNVRGTYDARSLPTVALRGQVAPFLSLAQWSISKANNQWRDVAMETKKGNLVPLIVTALTAAGVGITVEEANEFLSGGKKSQDATLDETLEVGGAGNITEKVADIMQLAGFMGVLSDVAKLGVRAARGKDIKYSNPLSFPGYTLVTDTLARNLSDGFSAINDGEDPLEVLPKMLVKIGTGSIQNARVFNNFMNADETERKNMFRDYRVWQEMTGRREPETGRQSNEFENMEGKKFKRTKSPEEAIELLPRLIDRALEKAGDDPEKLKQALSSLKRNSYQTMPDYRNNPMGFSEYYDYLERTQGSEEASKRVDDFIQTRELNKFKNRLVPSL